jgi:metal-sulfur cluster biosynthetic enzyme
MTDIESLRQEVIKTLESVIDPETKVNVIRMRLVKNLQIHPDGRVEYIFQPSSPLCPIALPLVMNIIETIKSIDGVTDQTVTVVDYAGADELNAILASIPPFTTRFGFYSY